MLPDYATTHPPLPADHALTNSVYSHLNSEKRH